MATQKVLLVEDEDIISTMFMRKMTEAGVDAILAKNGAIGLEVALKEHPDLILLDIVMPVMDGLTMLKKLRDDSWGKKASVIMLTNVNEDGKVAEVMETGTYEYFIKNEWKLDDLVVMIKEKLKAKI